MNQLISFFLNDQHGIIKHAPCVSFVRTRDNTYLVCNIYIYIYIYLLHDYCIIDPFALMALQKLDERHDGRNRRRHKG